MDLSRSDCHRLLDKIDLNNDGRIDFSEWLTFVAPFAKDESNDGETIKRAAKLIGDTMRITGDLHHEAAAKHGGGYGAQAAESPRGSDLDMRGLNLF